ncbi:MAG TPA: hypothetical protein VKH19_13890, partial [Gemmatimonadaceae bacterium]|nr:hypothetical protein [Gemmatimonadaceae bacterium]
MRDTFQPMIAHRLRKLANFAGRYASALAYATHTFTLGLRSPSRRAVISRLARDAGYAEYPRPELPLVGIDAISRDTTDVQLPFPEGSEGNVSLLELLVLCRVVRERAPVQLFEIGTFDGRSTAALAANAPAGAVVNTLDLPPDHPTR